MSGSPRSRITTSATVVRICSSAARPLSTHSTSYPSRSSVRTRGNAMSSSSSTTSTRAMASSIGGSAAPDRRSPNDGRRQTAAAAETSGTVRTVQGSRAASRRATTRAARAARPASTASTIHVSHGAEELGVAGVRHGEARVSAGSTPSTSSTHGSAPGIGVTSGDDVAAPSIEATRRVTSDGGRVRTREGDDVADVELVGGLDGPLEEQGAPRQAAAHGVVRDDVLGQPERGGEQQAGRHRGSEQRQPPGQSAPAARPRSCRDLHAPSHVAQPSCPALVPSPGARSTRPDEAGRPPVSPDPVRPPHAHVRAGPSRPLLEADQRGRPSRLPTSGTRGQHHGRSVLATTAPRRVYVRCTSG